MKITALTWLLILSTSLIASCQMEGPRIFSAGCAPGVVPPAPQLEEQRVPPASCDAVANLLGAKTALVLSEPELLRFNTKKDLAAWGRFQLVNDAEAADLIIVVIEYSSSRRTTMQRVKQTLAVFVCGRDEDTAVTPLWEVEETGVGKRPTHKLVSDLRNHLIKIERSVQVSAR